jgi:hypothetical protein
VKKVIAGATPEATGFGDTEQEAVGVTTATVKLADLECVDPKLSVTFVVME